MKTYPVDIDTTPSAAEPLAALYLASRGGPVNGQQAKPRAKLARIVGSGPLSDLLQSGRKILVAPRSPSVWEVKDLEIGQTPEDLLGDWVRAELKAQGLSLSELARRSGLPRSYCSYLVSGQRGGINITQARALLTGLGRSLSWFDQYLTERESDERARGTHETACDDGD